MKSIFSTLAMFIAMFSCVAILSLAPLSLFGFVYSCLALIALIIFWISPKARISLFIDLVDSKPAKTHRIMRWFYILIPSVWILMILFSFLNSWYQEGSFFYLYGVMFLLLFVLLEGIVIFSVKKWNTIKWKVILLTAIAFMLGFQAFNYFGQILREEQPINQKIVDLRFKHDLPEYTQMVKQIASKNITEEQEIPVPKDFPAERIFAWKPESGVLNIKIYMGGHGFAGQTHHWGYIYIPDDQKNHLDVRKNTRIRKILPCWYRYSD